MTPHGFLKIINNTGMPKGSNKFYAKDKLAVAKQLMSTVDPTKVYIGDFVADAQRFVQDKGIMPSEQLTGDAVAQVSSDGNNFMRVYHDGHTQSISQEVYVDESVYNFLPARFRTYKPGG